jgi:glutamate racemase
MNSVNRKKPGILQGTPMGIFDSGVGGLSIFQEIAKLLPSESIQYFADTKHCPYGERDPLEVGKFCNAITHFLLQKGCKIIVVACNTATAMAIDSLRHDFPNTPFVGMEPAIKPAALQSHTKAVGVLATAGTFHGRLFQNTRKRFASEVRVHTAVGTGLVELVEAGRADSPETDTLLRQYLSPMLDAGIDRLVLGCTHYAFLREPIQRITGDRVKLVTPGAAVARRVRQLLQERNLLADSPSTAQYEFYASGATNILSRMAGAAVSQIEAKNQLFSL